MSEANNTNSGSNSILTEQILIRLSKEEYDAWMASADENKLHVNLLVRKVMGIALGILPVVERINELVVAAKKTRAAHMRSFKREKPMKQAS